MQLRVVPPVFLADVFAKPVNVLDIAARQVVVQATVDAATVPADTASGARLARGRLTRCEAARAGGPVQVAVELLDGTRTIASARVPVMITGAGQVTVTGDADRPRRHHAVGHRPPEAVPRWWRH